MGDSQFIELRSTRPSWRMRLGLWLVARQKQVFPPDAQGVIDYLAGREVPEDAPMPDRFNRRFEVEHWHAAGHHCITLHPRGGKGARHILYFHGGGFILPMLEPHWPLVAAMAAKTGASLTVPLYPVAPEHSREIQDLVADAAYARLAGKWNPSDIILAGDSAGGNMALALALRLVRDDGRKPGKLVLFAPWLDVTLADEAARDVEQHDLLLKVDPLRVMGRAWAGETDPASARCSPLYASQGELAQLPPTRMFVGRNDLFVVDNRSFASRLHDAGVAVRLYEYAGAPHVFMALLMTREAGDCLRLVNEFVRR